MNNSQIEIYQTEDGLTRVNVRVEEDTVWLTQAQMAELFQTTKQNVSLHIGNAFKEGELDEKSVVKDYLTTAADGKAYNTNHYNLDVIISVGYRVKSLRGTQFRQWATKRLNEYIRKAEEADIPAIYDLIHENYVKVLPGYYTEEVLKKNMEELTQESFLSQMKVVKMYVLEDAGEMTAAGFFANAGEEGTPDYVLTALFVKVGRQSKGYGKRLFSHIVGLLREANAPSLRVPASTNAIPFYTRVGFVMDNEQPNTGDGINWMTMMF